MREGVPPPSTKKLFMWNMLASIIFFIALLLTFWDCKTYEMREQFYSGLDDESFLWAQQIADANDLDFGGPDGPDTD